jgi:hypothetical protein
MDLKISMQKSLISFRPETTSPLEEEGWGEGNGDEKS